MKKIPTATIVNIIVCLLLFGVFMIDYRIFNTSIDEQFESQAASKLSKINNRICSDVNTQLNLQIVTLDNTSDTMEHLTLDYDSIEFDRKLTQLSNNHIHIRTLSSAEDLRIFCDDSSLLSTYFSRLKNKKDILLSRFDTLYLLTPYYISQDEIVILYNQYAFRSIKDIIILPEPEDSGCSYLIDETGKIIACNEEYPTNTNFFNLLSSAEFLNGHSKDILRKNISEHQTGISHYSIDNTDTYAYYSPLMIDGYYLIHTVPSTILDQDVQNVASIAKHFTNSVLIIIFLLLVLIFAAEFFYTLKVNKNKEELILEQQRYKLALSHTRDTIWEYDITSDTLKKSDGSLGLYQGSSYITNFLQFIREHNPIFPDDVKVYSEFVSELLTDSKDCKVEVRSLTSNGAYQWYEVFGNKIFDSEGKPVFVVGQTVNINEKKLELELLKEKNGQDNLTKVYNSLTLKDKFIQMVTAMNQPMILGFLIIDVDEFRTLNEKLGHIFGDAVLIDISAKISKLLKKTDLIGRVGGDEFIVILYDAPSISYVNEMADQIRSLFHDICTGEESHYDLTGSIGISLYPSDGTDYDSLYNRAELALYHSKLHGRDQIALYDSSMADLSKADIPIRKKSSAIKYQHEDRSTVDSSIIANAIEILFDSREIDISINLMLSLIGIYYNLGRMEIYEYSDDEKSVSITHEWYSDPKYRVAEMIQDMPVSLLEPYSFFAKGDSGIMHCNDITEDFKNLDTSMSYINLGNVKSLFQCGISDHAHYVGFISASIFENVHEWTKNEVDSLSLLSKIIGSYLIRLRSVQKADMITQRDLLTNTYNFNTFLSVVNQHIKSKQNQNYAMIYSDIYQFKLINDNYGYQAGDHILKSLAQIFLSVGGSESIVCRITGDKFVILMPFDTIDNLSHNAEEILIKSKQITDLENDCYRINVMIGIYVMAKDDSAIVAVDRANIARKNAQKLRKENYVFFSEAMRSALIEQKKIEDVMEQALIDEEFMVYYQPKINIDTGQICGAEALIRWNRSDTGLVPPSSFIPLFEDNGFIVNIDYYVLEKTCQYLRERIDSGYQVFPISVNFSRAHFMTDILPEHLLTTVQKYHLSPELIEVEITESALVNSDHYWMHILEKIKDYGFCLAMDDFGSGLSSLNLLCDLPFKVLKIDKDFFHSKTTNKRERIVISNIVRMAKELDMIVICEGVETLEQALFLKSIDCNMAQGFYYDKPLPVEEFDKKYMKLIKNEFKEQ